MNLYDYNTYAVHAMDNNEQAERDVERKQLIEQARQHDPAQFNLLTIVTHNFIDFLFGEREWQEKPTRYRTLRESRQYS